MCFHNIKISSIYSLCGGYDAVCQDCLASLKPKFIRFKSNGVKCLSIYDYDDVLKNQIYQFKGCYDVELRSIFLQRFSKELSLLYKGYIMVPAPSFLEDNLRRGYNHVQEIFSCLNLPMEDVFEKTEKFKQAEHGYFGRKNINKFIRIKEGKIIGKKKILLVDDIYTTGSTFNTMVLLLKEQGITDIKGLVIAKTKLK